MNNPKPNETYIEKGEDGGRVFVVRTITDKYVTSSCIDYTNGWRVNSTRIRRKEFERRMELSPIQIR